MPYEAFIWKFEGWMTLQGYYLHFSEEIHSQMHPNGEADYALLGERSKTKRSAMKELFK